MKGKTAIIAAILLSALAPCTLLAQMKYSDKIALIALGKYLLNLG